MSKHTKGPWSIDSRPSVRRQGYVAISAPSHDALAQVVWQMEGDDKPLPEGVANAHLIAAAPELLEALAWYVAEDDVIEDMPGNEFWVAGKRRAQAAIAKATGEA